jgi:Uma2 family endonuclease
MSASLAGQAESTTEVRDNGSSAPVRVEPLQIPDDMLYEVVNGTVVEKIVGASEVEIAAILDQYLGMFVRTHRLGRVVMEMIFPIDLAKDLERRPDVAFISHARWPFHRRVPNVAVWDMIPDLAIEVVSPANTANGVQEKVDEYFRAGVHQVWVVYPGQQTVYVYQSPTQIEVLRLGGELDGGELLPGFRLPLGALFEDDAE